MDFRSKAETVVADGAAERADFTPHGVPLKVYNYWDKHKIFERKGTENFCHYWRVVAFWAPLTFVRVSFVKAITSPLGAGIALALYLSTAIGFIVNDHVLVGAGFMLAVPYTAIGIFSGCIRYEEWDLDCRNQTNEILFPATFLVSVPTYGVCRFSKWLSHQWNHDWDMKVLDILVATLGVFGVLALGFVIGVSLASDFVATLIILGSVIVFAALVVGASISVENRRKNSKRKRENKLADYYEEHGHYPRDEEPGRVKRFFSGVVDFLVLLAQIIRVKKWKVCPLVRIEK